MHSSAASQIPAFLLSASNDSLSSTLALIEDLSMLNLVWGKGADLFNRLDSGLSKGTWSSNSNHFSEQVVAKSKEFAALSSGERLLRVIGELQKLVSVQARDLRTSLDLEEVADDICMAGVKILREDKKGNFTGNDVGSMIEFQMTRIFAGLKISMEELLPEQQQSLIESVRSFIGSLPADQQQFILDKLGTTELSEAAIGGAIASGAIWTAFAAAVQVFGFAFYTTAAHLLAIVSLGTLPFGAYIGLSSLIAVLSSAWMVPVFVTLGTWYYVHKNAAMRQSMAPLLVTSLCLSGMEVKARGTGQQNDAVEGALALWCAARDLRDGRRSDASKAKWDRDDAQGRLSNTRGELSRARERKSDAERKKCILNDELAGLVMNSTGAIAKGLWGNTFIATATRIEELEVEIGNARQKRDRNPGLWQRIKGYAEYSLSTASLRSGLTLTKTALVRKVQNTSQNERFALPEKASEILRKVDEMASQILSTEADISRLKKSEREQSGTLDRAVAALGSAASAQARAEKRYYGLGAV